MSTLLNTFWAFNTNAAAHIIYNMQSDYWLLLLIVAAVTSIVLTLKEQAGQVVRDEQNII